MSYYVGRILWATVSETQNPKPYLCVSESTDNKLLTTLEMVDLEYADVLCMLVADIDMIIHKGGAYWDDQ